MFSLAQVLPMFDDDVRIGRTLLVLGL